MKITYNTLYLYHSSCIVFLILFCFFSSLSSLKKLFGIICQAIHRYLFLSDWLLEYYCVLWFFIFLEILSLYLHIWRGCYFFQFLLTSFRRETPSLVNLAKESESFLDLFYGCPQSICPVTSGKFLKLYTFSWFLKVRIGAGTFHLFSWGWCLEMFKSACLLLILQSCNYSLHKCTQQGNLWEGG